MKVLVTGGLGYIGSHVVVELQQEGYDVLIIDNLSNSKLEVIDNISKITDNVIEFEKIDLTSLVDVFSLFSRHKIDAVIHLAALKSISESIQHPLDYYSNNIVGTMNLIDVMIAKKVDKIVFSSTCAVYGDERPHSQGYYEWSDLQPNNPYSISKRTCEEILSTINLSSISLRYFNPIGAHESGLIGESPNKNPDNIVPVMCEVANKLRDKLIIFGDDYDTVDGTCERDYIHVMDVAKAHIQALKVLINNDKEKISLIFNIGTGNAISVLVLIKTFESVTEQKLLYEFGSRRIGDIVSMKANCSHVNLILDWFPKYTLGEALLSAWKWKLKNS